MLSYGSHSCNYNKYDNNGDTKVNGLNPGVSVVCVV